MAAVPEDLETQPHVRAVPADAAPASHQSPSRDEVRAISRRVVTEHERLIALLAAYDSQQSEPPSENH